MERARHEDEPDAEVEAFLAGTESALAGLYARWSPLVYGVALRALDDVSEAERVTRSVFSRAWAERHTFDPQRQRLATWLITMAQERVSEARAGAECRFSTRSGSTTATEDRSRIRDLVQQHVVADQLSRLDAVSQLVLRMALFEQLTHTEIAERTQLSAPTVTEHLQRGLARLRKGLEVTTDAHRS